MRPFADWTHPPCHLQYTLPVAPMELTKIEAGNQLITLLAMGAILLQSGTKDSF